MWHHVWVETATNYRAIMNWIALLVSIFTILLIETTSSTRVNDATAKDFYEFARSSRKNKFVESQHRSARRDEDLSVWNAFVSIAAKPENSATLASDIVAMSISDVLSKDVDDSEKSIDLDTEWPDAVLPTITIPDHNVSLTCLYELALWIESLKEQETWAVKMVDAMGKFPPGILDGNVLAIGRYDMCVRIPEEENFPFDKTSYCLSYLGKFLTGFCLPSHCNASDLDFMVKAGFPRYLSKRLPEVEDFYTWVDLDEPVCERPLGDYTFGELIIIVWASLLLLMIIAGTIFDMFLMYVLKKEYDFDKAIEFLKPRLPQRQFPPKRKKDEDLVRTRRISTMSLPAGFDNPSFVMEEPVKVNFNNRIKLMSDNTPKKRPPPLDIEKARRLANGLDQITEKEDEAKTDVVEENPKSPTTPIFIRQLTDLCKAETLDEYDQIKKEIIMDHIHDEPKHAFSGDPDVKSFIQAFSLITNIKAIFHCKSVKGDGFVTLNGLRVGSLMWMILQHTHTYSISYIDNYFEMLRKIANIPFQVIVNGTVAVDTFFFLSGFLSCFWTIRKLKERGDNGNLKFWVVNYYLRRLYRIVPIYAFGILAMTTIWHRFGNGPQFILPQFTTRICLKNWWTNLLFINNYYPVHAAEKCMSWTWFAAADMQMWFTAPIFIYSLHKNWKVGLGVCVLGILTAMAASFGLTFQYGLPATYWGQATVNTTAPDIDYYYTKVYCRIPPNIIGILLAYYFSTHTKAQRGVKINMALVFLGWLIAAVIACSAVFGLIDHFEHILEPDFKSAAVKAIYNSCARLAWGCCIAWVVFACASGNGGVIKLILGWQGWIVMAKLCFCCYLIHPSVIILYYAEISAPMHYSNWTMMYHYVGFLFSCFGIALLLVLLAEIPMQSLERYIRENFYRVHYRN